MAVAVAAGEMDRAKSGVSSVVGSPSVRNMMKVLQQGTCVGLGELTQAGLVPKKYGSRAQAPEIYPSPVGHLSAGGPAASRLLSPVPKPPAVWEAWKLGPHPEKAQG